MTTSVDASAMPGARALRPLWEDASRISGDVRGSGMPEELERRYGAPLRVPLHAGRPTIIANFVSTLDGIVAFGQGDLSGGGVVSGFHEPDRFVMGLLRALADVVMIGAGTLRGSTGHSWTPGHVHPGSAPLFAEWRAAMGLPEHPTTVVVTASGDLPTEHPALHDARVPIVIATTAAGAQRLAGARLGDHVTIEQLGAGPILHTTDLVGIGGRHGRLILTEGGPHVMGDLVGADAIDELFLTLAPQLAGRGTGERLGLVEGLALSPGDARWQELVSIRQSGDHLFLRYRRQDRPGTTREA